MTPELVAAIIAVLMAAANWLKSKTEIDKIKADRLETKSSRDEAAQQMHDDLIRMQCKQNLSLTSRYFLNKVSKTRTTSANSADNTLKLWLRFETFWTPSKKLRTNEHEAIQTVR